MLSTSTGIREKQISLTGKTVIWNTFRLPGSKALEQFTQGSCKIYPLDIFKKMFSQKYLTEMVKIYPSYLISEGQINTCTLEILSRFVFPWVLYIWRQKQWYLKITKEVVGVIRVRKTLKLIKEIWTHYSTEDEYIKMFTACIFTMFQGYWKGMGTLVLCCNYKVWVEINTDFILVLF